MSQRVRWAMPSPTLALMAADQATSSIAWHRAVSALHGTETMQDLQRRA